MVDETTLEGFKNEILEAISGYADNIEVRLLALEKGQTRIESLMVTKDYLDDKMADLRGDLLTVLRKEDTRLTRMIEKLREKNLFDDHDVEELLRLQPLVPIPR
ncbi:MAG: hypothetical protein Q8P11_04335 [bacterium]|nr:hypothetical protein [bacterium]